MAVRTKRDTGSFLSKFYQQRDADIIKQAEENGFFFNPTEETLLLQCQVQNPDRKNLADFRLIQLCDVHLRVLGDIRMCTSLTICLLANNFLTKIDALVSCTQLIRLDVHSNQLASVPGCSFWRSLDKLQVLHLHDNPLAKFESLQALGSSPCLSVLTLYDTPLSLKKNYRHHVVNTIWTLKALDMHVISDEEIIEDAVFRYAQFAALSPAFRVDLCPKTSTDLTYPQELCVFHSLIARVNSVLARHSPVHIVQKYVRGHLTRKRLGIIKKHGLLRLKETMTHLPSTPVFPSSPLYTPNTREVVDYDSYMAGWRQSLLNEPFYEQIGTTLEQISLQEYLPFSINIERLQSGILTKLQAKITTETTLTGREYLRLGSKKEREKKHTKQEMDKKPKSKRIQDIKKFFGPVVQTVSLEMEDDEIPQADFRIRGRKPHFLTVDATTEMILSKKEAGELIREAEEVQKRKELLQPPMTVKRNRLTTIEQRLFNKTHGTMSLSCLMAVHKAYKEREKAEAAAVKSENNLGWREERLQAKDKIRRHHSEKRLKVLQTRDMEKSQILEQLEKQEVQKLIFLNRLHEQKVQRSHFKKMQQADCIFMQEFHSQRSSISNTLQRYDRQAYVEDNKKSRQKEVSEMKKTEQAQKEAVKNYLEHQKMTKQKEIALAKVALQTKLQNETKVRILEAQNRVSCLKAKNASNVDVYTLPYSSVSHSSAVPPAGILWEAPYEESSVDLLYRQHALSV
ncbi:unnamed protein product [Candidula unifasciata]|uniref:Leucine-rich repeat and IQ domain-containing protein 3 n=1 Tax=Candidula unifasciata TaxID=100452 RepID=A0A8S4A241_9EUPU|nr:unnamed protein product [Candidula unifasciata]